MHVLPPTSCCTISGSFSLPRGQDSRMRPVDAVSSGLRILRRALFSSSAEVRHRIQQAHLRADRPYGCGKIAGAARSTKPLPGREFPRANGARVTETCRTPPQKKRKNNDNDKTRVAQKNINLFLREPECAHHTPAPPSTQPSRLKWYGFAVYTVKARSTRGGCMGRSTLKLPIFFRAAAAGPTSSSLLPAT